MPSIKIGKNKEVLLRLDNNTSPEFHTELVTFIKDTDPELLAALRNVVNVNWETPYHRLTVKKPVDYLEGSDVKFEHETVLTKEYRIYKHFQTGEIVDLSVPGHKEIDYEKVAYTFRECKEERPWYVVRVRRIAEICTATQQVPFFLSPKRTRFNDTSVVRIERHGPAGTWNPYHSDSPYLGEPLDEIDTGTEELFAHVDTKDGGTEFERLASFEIKI